MRVFGKPPVRPVPDSFEAGLLEHVDGLYAVARRLTKSSLDAEDLVQDSLVKAMRARDQYQAGTNIKAWLFKILTNTFINKFHRGGLERTVLEGPDADPLADGWVGAATMRSLRDPETQALRPLVQKEIARALGQLPEEFRLTVLLADVQELSYKEIADVMGCPVGTVMSRLHRGRKLLQQKLYDHAVLAGIATPTLDRDDQNAVEPVDIAAFRAKKRGRP